ncbi:hypothetical protein KUA02_05220 [Komagataeibacter pomaceti]|nr:hypothetical protein [Novacetimonas pomaceti]
MPVHLHVREVQMLKYSHRPVRTDMFRRGNLNRWDIIGPAMLAAAFALSTALIFLA